MAPKSNNPLAPALAAGGALLLIISLFLDWFSLDVSIPGAPKALTDDLPGIARPDTATLLLAAAAGVAIIIAIGRFRGTIAGKADVLAGLGAATLIYALINLIKKPQLLDLVESSVDKAISSARATGQEIPDGADFTFGIGIGLIIALLGAALLLAAGLMEMLGSGGGARAGAATGGLGAGSGGQGGYSSPPAGGGGATTVQPTAGGTAPPPTDGSAGWKPDPYGQAQMRYWDGASWTEHTG
jgi:hypothetical protein